MTLPKFFLLKLLKSEVLSVRFQNRSKKVTSVSVLQNLLEWFIWTRKKNLWQTFHSSSGNSELLHSKRKLFEYDYEFLKKLHRRKKSLNGHVIWTFDKPAEVWKPKSEYFNLRVRIVEEKISFFSENCDFGQIFPADWENSVPALMPPIQGKSHYFLVIKGRQKKLIHFPAKRFYFKCFRDTKKSSFDNSAAIFPLKSILFSLIVQKISQKIHKSFRKPVFVQMFLWRLQCSFDTPVVLSFAAVKVFFCSNFKKRPKCSHFSRLTSIIFPRSVFWTRDLPFWQGRR